MKYFKTGILIVTSLIVIWVITSISGFTYLNLSSMTPMDEQLKFLFQKKGFNFIIEIFAYLIGLAFTIWTLIVEVKKMRK